MKTNIFVALLLPVACFAQQESNTAPVRPATADCPTWNKPMPKSTKAQYWEYIRVNGKAPKPVSKVTGGGNQVEENASEKPVIQRKSALPPLSRSQDIAAQEKVAPPPPVKKEQPVQEQPPQEEALVPAEKGKITGIARPIEEKPEKTTVPTEKEKITDTAQSEEKKAESETPKNVSADKSKSINKNKIKRENRKIKRQAKHPKKVKISRRGNQKCPDF